MPEADGHDAQQMQATEPDAPERRKEPAKPDPGVVADAVEVPIAPHKDPLPERLGFAKKPKPTKAKPIKHGYTGLILTKKGDGEVYAIPDGPAIKRQASKGGGIYVKETYARYWIPEAIPPGWLTIWPEDDPEPFSGREPVGYGSRTLDLLTGSHVAHVIGLGMKDTAKQMPDWMKWVGIAIVVLVAIAFIGVWAYQKATGA